MAIRAGGAVAELQFPGEVRLIGYGPGAPRRTSATLNRLRIRAIVLEDDAGERLALVSGDFWAASSWIHARLGGQLGENPALGLDRSRVFFSGTHTHCSAGGLFESPYYSRFAQAYPLDQGFDHDLAWSVADQLAQLVIRACGALQPATLSVANGDFSTESINRSYGAHVANDGQNPDAPYPEPLGRTAVDPALDLLVARALDGTIIGVWGAVNCHGTALGKNIEDLSPDFLGSAARSLEGDFAANAAPWVLCSGAIGDVDPQPAGKTRDQFIALRKTRASAFNTMYRLADALKDAALQAVTQNEGPLRDTLRFEARRVDALVPGAQLATGARMPDVPMIGNPVLRGSELGQGPLSSEGHRKQTWDDHPHWPKLASIIATAAANIAMAEHDQRLSLSLFKLGDLMWLVGLPGEPTTRFSANVKSALENAAGAASLLVCGVNGGYNGYFVTRPEYDAQHYEGASCIWGPHTEPFIIEQLLALTQPQPPPPTMVAMSLSISAPLALSVAVGLGPAPVAKASVPEVVDSKKVDGAMEERFAWITATSPHKEVLLELGAERISPLVVQEGPKKKGRRTWSVSFLVYRHQLGKKGQLVRLAPSGKRFKLTERAPRARATAKAPARKKAPRRA